MKSSAVAASVAASAVATSVAWLLARRHVDIFVLDGGYRAYRLHLRDLLEPGPRVIGVSGRTRSGKTRALGALAAKNYQVLDREALTAHSCSAFGDLKGVAQPSNAAFETKCAWAWRALDARRDVFVDDEEGHVDAVHAVRADDLFETDAAADAVVVTLSRADAAEFHRRHP